MVKKVMAFGTFDGIHPGHIYYLEQAKKFGELTVVIARDETVKKVKGRKTLFKEKERKKMIESLKAVDKTVFGAKKESKFEILKKFKPEIIVLGYDQKPSKKELEKELKKMNLKAEIKRVKALNSKRFKSSKLKKKIIELIS
ncbi:MAG: FAD synthase [Candidatus Diapherotrites archaeon CG10_big_fil_rev_8_21_14_0_10_31_34]|nr:MAG: FAD synthase [Candidatus Diapherotrites archaeon CG10_big_fil_rev_8_21_14_0_10_31_34]